MTLERRDIEHIAALARIALSDEEVEALREQLSNIMDQFRVLNELDTSGVAPTGHAAQLVGVAGVMREDVASESLEPEDVLLNAPRREGEFFRVKVVLEE
jgi:aspartyl-tRNA(Asn)/glutamyl-tRNA(Gln) amidotransferase subunit C